MSSTLSLAELIAEAGKLNNHPNLVNVDHVSIMGLMDRDECQRHVERLRSLTDPAVAKTLAA